jgi:hypothetical protein
MGGEGGRRGDIKAKNESLLANKVAFKAAKNAFLFFILSVYPSFNALKCLEKGFACNVSLKINSL